MSSEDPNWEPSEERKFPRSEEYAAFNNCIGLSPIVFGTPGPYVQSDIQFALSILDYHRRNKTVQSSINDYLTGVDSAAGSEGIKLNTRYFTRENEGDDIADYGFIETIFAKIQIEFEEWKE